jgi:integrase/recombinase XerD
LKTLPSKRGGTLSTATINQTLYSLQSFFRWLTAREYIERDPMLQIQKLKPDPVRSLEWNDDEVKALFDVLDQREQTLWRDQAMLWILLHGLRASEVSALDVKDFDGQRLHILEAKDDSVGTVPLLAEGVEAIENYLNWRQSEGLGIDKASPLLLSHSRRNHGERFGYAGIYKAVKAIAFLARVSNAFPHRGRHTMATNLVLRGVDPMLARQITRHKSEKSFGRYSQRALEVEAENQFYKAFGEG